MNEEEKMDTSRLGRLSYTALGMLGGIVLAGLLAWGALSTLDMIRDAARETAVDAAKSASDEHTKRLHRLEQSNAQVIKWITEVSSNPVNKAKPKPTPSPTPVPE